MTRLSNFFFGFLNAFSLLLGLAAIAASLYFHVHGATNCQKFLQTPLLLTGLVLFVVSLLGLIGSCCRVNFMLMLYLIIMFLLIVGLIGFTAFVLVVTNSGAGKAVSGLGYKEYKLGDYSNWLQNHFVNGKNWGELRSCLVDAQVCKSLANEPITNIAVFYKKVSPVQFGCCKPPIDCGFKYKNATFWEAPTGGVTSKEPDCAAWSNDQNKLCYDCNSCKGGVLANIRVQWRILAIINMCALFIITIAYCTGCCTRRNNKKDKYRSYRGYP